VDLGRQFGNLDDKLKTWVGLEGPTTKCPEFSYSDGRVGTVCGEGIGHLGRQILVIDDEYVHHNASVQNVNRGVTALVDG